MRRPPDEKGAAPRANAVQPQNAKMPRVVFFGKVRESEFQADCKQLEQAFDRIDALCSRILSRLEVQQ